MMTLAEKTRIKRGLDANNKKLGAYMDAHEFAHYTADVLDPDDDMTFYQMSCKLAEAVDPEPARQAIEQLADEMDSHWVGVEGMDDSPVADWARRLRGILG